MTRRKVDQQASRIKTRLVRTVKFVTPWSIATLRRWTAEGRLFCVRWRGRDLYPAFQFGTADFPWYGMKRILSHVPQDARGWPLLSWFEARNVLLKGRKPSQALKTMSSTRLAEAAESFYSLED